jgi:anaerobic selenocysteine-containing dehydrogenase
MLVTTELRDGQRVATEITGDPAHPTTAGKLCTKVARYLERVYHPDRLLHPLKRAGAKGSGIFERVSWDEALADIAQRLQRIAAVDAQRIVPYSYAGTMGIVQGEAMAQRFFNRLGASRLDRTICAEAGAQALNYTLGSRMGTDLEQFQNAKLILLWGTNAIASNLHFWSRAQEAKRRGAKLVAIDPYRSLTAEKCHEHIALLPGTDAALALGLVHVMAREHWLDEDYIEKHTLGAELLLERARNFPPARVAEICGITATGSRTSRATTRRRGRPPFVSITACSVRVAAATRCVRSPASRPSRGTGATRPAACCCLPAANSAPTVRRSIARSCSAAARRARST